MAVGMEVTEATGPTLEGKGRGARRVAAIAPESNSPLEDPLFLAWIEIHWSPGLMLLGHAQQLALAAALK